MKRRDALLLIAAGTAVNSLGSACGQPPARPVRSGLGVVIYSLALRRKALQAEVPPRDLFEPLTYLEYCRGLGAGGIQLPLGIRDTDDCRRLRQQAEQYGMYVDGIVNTPQDQRGRERFEAELRTAAAAGVAVLRTTTLPGRRYEQFASRDEYLAAAQRSREAIQHAVPLVERYKIRLAIENHKDRRSEELAALLRELGSEHVGACVDLGNNFTLLEDPLAAVETLAPWAFSVHVKDQAVQECDEGFLLADVPLGDGFLDLPKMVEILRRARPTVRFNLETIVRDPLQVPVLTERYWATFPDVPGSDLARTLRIVRDHRSERLPQISTLAAAEQLACESAGIGRSLRFARETLKL